MFRSSHNACMNHDQYLNSQYLPNLGNQYRYCKNRKLLLRWSFLFRIAGKTQHFRFLPLGLSGLSGYTGSGVCATSEAIQLPSIQESTVSIQAMYFKTHDQLVRTQAFYRLDYFVYLVCSIFGNPIIEFSSSYNLIFQFSMQQSLHMFMRWDVTIREIVA